MTQETLDRADLRAKLAEAPLKLKPYDQVDLEAECSLMTEPGWMFDMLFQLEGLMWGRWPYWMAAWAKIDVPEGPIPQLGFVSTPHPFVVKMLNHTIECCFHGTVDRYRAFRWLVEWLKWSLGASRTKPDLPNPDIPSDKIAYQVFQLDPMILYPYDYFGHWLAEAGHGKSGTAFFPTPMGVTELMGQMVFDRDDIDKVSKVLDPAVGTGRTLLLASNYSLRLYAQDIDQMVLDCLAVNFMMYAPWGAKPLPPHVYGDEAVSEEE